MQPHNQDPRKPEFFTSGYGAGIKKRYKPDGKARIATYIVIENDPADFSAVVGRIPLCFGKSWRDIGRCSHRRAWVLDLFKSFGSLGIPNFIYMNTQNISLGRGNTTLDAVKLYKLLEAVAGRFNSKAKIEVDWDPDSNGGDIGMAFAPKVKSDKWDELVQPRDGIVGWFGYGQHEKTSTLDVWFYCGSAKAAARVHQLLLEKPFPHATISRPDQENNVWISLPAEKSSDNQDWFISVFNSVVQRA